MPRRALYKKMPITLNPKTIERNAKRLRELQHIDVTNAPPRIPIDAEKSCDSNNRSMIVNVLEMKTIVVFD